MNSAMLRPSHRILFFVLGGLRFAGRALALSNAPALTVSNRLYNLDALSVFVQVGEPVSPLDQRFAS